MEKNIVRRIALIGAESTGKTTLAASLALRFNTLWVPELARDYVSRNQHQISPEEIESISRAQLAEEDKAAANANQLLFTDTEFIIAKVWCEDVYNTCPDWIIEMTKQHRYDLYLLTSNDLPWIPDPVRINAQRRDYFFNLYKKELEKLNVPFEVVSGRYENRLFNAVKIIKKYFPDID
ncbi:MAG: hypothetical protein Fur0041_09540 [Bacteroidia bacterium]